MIIYLHGFRSSPHSYKVRLLAERMQELGRSAEFFCPQLPASPKESVQLVLDYLNANRIRSDQVTLIGSSLGGFYATWLAQKLACRAVLLNPAVKPAHDLEKYVGVTTDYHTNEPFEFKREYIAEMQELLVAHITQPERYFLIAATGDEVLDWREMVAHYPNARQRVIEGSDHGLSDFPAYMDEVLTFCGIAGLPDAS